MRGATLLISRRGGAKVRRWLSKDLKSRDWLLNGLHGPSSSPKLEDADVYGTLGEKWHSMDKETLLFMQRDVRERTQRVAVNGLETSSHLSWSIGRCAYFYETVLRIVAAADGFDTEALRELHSTSFLRGWDRNAAFVDATDHDFLAGAPEGVYPDSDEMLTRYRDVVVDLLNQSTFFTDMRNQVTPAHFLTDTSTACSTSTCELRHAYERERIERCRSRASCPEALHPPTPGATS